jgi:glycosyltransferase involved in cell wall biosynthesis
MPRVSVVIPTHNRAEYIQQALDSVFAQSYSDYEVIVVDDGSTDGSAALLKPLVERGAIRYEQQTQSGVSAARNRGIALALGEYVAFLDSDDLWLPDKLAKQVTLLEGLPELGFVHCLFEKFDEARGVELGLRDTSAYRGQIYPQLLMEWNTLMATPCMLMRKDVLDEVGGYDEAMRWGEDLDLWRRIAQRYPVDLVNEVLVRVRVHAASASTLKTNALPDFRRYLDKAFADDSELSLSFRRRAYARMYLQFARNLLGEGGGDDMHLARRLSLRAMGQWPLQFNALFVWLATLLPAGWRARLAAFVRSLRYAGPG